MYSASLTPEEINQLKNGFLGPAFQVFAAGVTKIYVSRPERAQWEETGLVGVWTFFAHEPTKTLYLQLLDLQTGTRFFTQELYEGFEYLQATPYFHTFESDNSILGVSFALEQDAARFHAAVKEAINKKQYRMRPSTFKKVWRTGLGTFTSWRGAKKERKPEQAMAISSPSGFKHESHMGFSNGEFGFWYFQRTLNISAEEVDKNAAQLLSVAAHHELKNKLRLSAELQQQQQQHGAVPPAPPSGGVTTGDVEPPIDGRDTPAVAPPPPPPEGGHYQYTPRPCPPKELPGRPEDMPQEQQEDLADVLKRAIEAKFGAGRRNEEEEEQEEEQSDDDDLFGADEPFES
ncbi:WH1 domain containing protein [Acanthamoeba castellanii str. Neff]|uniref:WH1 domain containing protein n=1 Tax=Acanthamoeba castellanii (strain ATCC 30010 / Neff) TaxID=1257118 RepID=L8H6L6_ACACF|nr:WH1 domain containing protein [Acanthamoeba castellanii str. Neff]ELR20892.1 WH1 domain containing protein [Acanthamoeba castellanii str. Neff]